MYVPEHPPAPFAPIFAKFALDVATESVEDVTLEDPLQMAKESVEHCDEMSNSLPLESFAVMRKVVGRAAIADRNPLPEY